MKPEPVQVDAEPVGVLLLFPRLARHDETVESSTPAGAFVSPRNWHRAIGAIGEGLDEEFSEDDLEDGFDDTIEAEETEFEEIESSSASPQKISH